MDRGGHSPARKQNYLPLSHSRSFQDAVAQLTLEYDLLQIHLHRESRRFFRALRPLVGGRVQRIRWQARCRRSGPRIFIVTSSYRSNNYVGAFGAAVLAVYCGRHNSDARHSSRSTDKVNMVAVTVINKLNTYFSTVKRQRDMRFCGLWGSLVRGRPP